MFNNGNIVDNTNNNMNNNMNNMNNMRTNERNKHVHVQRDTVDKPKPLEKDFAIELLNNNVPMGYHQLLIKIFNDVLENGRKKHENKKSHQINNNTNGYNDRKKKTGEIICKYDPNCRKLVCTFKHTKQVRDTNVRKKMCKYGTDCNHRETCFRDHGDEHNESYSEIFHDLNKYDSESDSSNDELISKRSSTNEDQINSKVVKISNNDNNNDDNGNKDDDNDDDNDDDENENKQEKNENKQDKNKKK